MVSVSGFELKTRTVRHHVVSSKLALGHAEVTPVESRTAVEWTQRESVAASFVIKPGSLRSYSRDSSHLTWAR